jgi:hypothetical protein
MFAEISTIRNNKNRKNFKLGRRAAESLAGARGKCFFMGPISNFFPEKTFFGQRQPPSPNFGTLPKKTNILPWGPTKIF